MPLTEEKPTTSRTRAAAVPSARTVRRMEKSVPPRLPDDLTNTDALRAYLLAGHVIPAHPLALNANRQLDARRQRALSRYYHAAGAGGIAVGVHTTQFAIRERGLYAEVLHLAADTVKDTNRPYAMVAGVCGMTEQAIAEARTARTQGYHAGLLSLSAYRNADDAAVLAHCRAVAQEIPVIGFYLQPAVGGRVFSYDFWRRFFEIENVVAVKMAPFNRYQTIDVVRACIRAGRDDVALYTGNDDAIVTDLLTPWEFANESGQIVRRRVVGGLLGHWAAWTHRAVELLSEVKALGDHPTLDAYWLTRAAQITDANAALFDAAHGFHGCIAGIHEVLRRQGLLEGIWCLDPNEGLSPGQADEITRVAQAYPAQTDDDFVAQHRDAWLR